MIDKVRKQLGEPKSDLEKDTLEYIEPLVNDMIEEDIIGKGLTLKGCIEFCFKKGKKFEVRTNNTGFARISDEQHFAWVREYFGIENSVAKVEDKAKEKSAALELNLDSLLD